MLNTSIRDTLSRLDRWCKPSNELLEKSLETLLLLDLFRQSLGYSRDTAVSQHRDVVGRADIVLKLNRRQRSKWVVVEVKRPS